MQQDHLNPRPKLKANEVKSEFNQALALAWSICVEAGIVYLGAKLLAEAENTGWTITEGAPNYLTANSATYALAIKPVNLTVNGTLAANSGYGMDPNTTYPQTYANQQSYFGLAYDAAQDPTDTVVTMLDIGFWLAAALAIYHFLEKVKAKIRGEYDVLDYRTNREIAEVLAADREDYIREVHWVETQRNAGVEGSEMLQAPVAPRKRTVVATPFGLGGGYFASEDVPSMRTQVSDFLKNNAYTKGVFETFVKIYPASSVEVFINYAGRLAERFGYSLVFTGIAYLAMNTFIDKEMLQSLQNSLESEFPDALADVVAGGGCTGALLMADCVQIAEGRADMEGTYNQENTLDGDEMKARYYGSLLSAVAIFVVLEVSGLMISCFKKKEAIIEDHDNEYAQVDDADDAADVEGDEENGIGGPAPAEIPAANVTENKSNVWSCCLKKQTVVENPSAATAPLLGSASE